MKNFITTLCVLFLLAGCFGGTTGPEVKEPGVDTEISYFRPKYNKEIAIFPTYRFVGTHEYRSEKAYRKYHLWKEDRTGKYILITVFTPVNAEYFDKDIRWVSGDGAIYRQGNITAFNYLHSRVHSTITQLDTQPPPCLIIAQEFYIDRLGREAIFKALIVPDEMCSEIAEPVVQELNRVANVQP